MRIVLFKACFHLCGNSTCKKDGVELQDDASAYLEA